MTIKTALLAAGILAGVGCSTQSSAPITASTNDTDLRQNVQSKLAADSQLAQVAVSADASLNQVVLTGSVPTAESRDEAVAMARASGLNLNVVDNIEVAGHATTAREDATQTVEASRAKAKAVGDKIGRKVDDAWLYTKIAGKLVGHSAAPVMKIRIDVHDNVVTLRGEVRSVEMKREAERIARETDGVIAVRNLLQVKA